MDDVRLVANGGKRKKERKQSEEGDEQGQMGAGEAGSLIFQRSEILRIGEIGSWGETYSLRKQDERRAENRVRKTHAKKKN